jgi:hypothetical protein
VRDSQPRGTHADYDGGSASALYDRIFQPGAPVPHLETHIPQAITTWTDWDGSGDTLLLLGMYSDGNPSYLVGLEPDSGEVVGTVMIDPSHVGGMGFIGSWLFAQDDNPHRGGPYRPAVRRYRIDALRAAMERSAESGDRVYLATDGPPDPIEWIDFFAVEGDSVYAGNHGNPGPGRMWRYRLTPEGHLQQIEGPWWVPARAQGLVLTPQDFVFSSDGGVDRGRLTVIRRGPPDRIADPIACVWIPAMPEDMTVDGGTLFVAFESGAKRYEGEHPVNRITTLHAGSLDELLRFADPAALEPGVHWESA